MNRNTDHDRVMVDLTGLSGRLTEQLERIDLDPRTSWAITDCVAATELVAAQANGFGPTIASIHASEAARIVSASFARHGLPRQFIPQDLLDCLTRGIADLLKEPNTEVVANALGAIRDAFNGHTPDLEIPDYFNFGNTLVAINLFVSMNPIAIGTSVGRDE